MGSAQSYITSEAALTALVVAGAIGIGYTQLGAASPSMAGGSLAVTSVEGQGTASKKGKKKKQTKTGGTTAGDISETLSASKSQSQRSQQPQPRVVAFPEVIPGQFDVPPALASATEPFLQEDLASSSNAKKSKKKKAKGKAAVTTTEPAVPQAVLSSVDYLSETSTKAIPTKNTKRQPLQSQQPQKSISSSSQLTRPVQRSTTSIDTDGSWTRVGPHRHGPTATDADSSALSAEADPTTSDAGITTSVTGNSSPVAERRASTSTEDDSFLLNTNASPRGSGENRRTLAEKLLPKPRKTGVDDMLETSDFPTLSRVIRVQPLPNEKPATGFSWGDYEDVRVVTDGGENDADGEDDGWGVVTSKRPKRNLQPSSSSQAHVQKAPEALTKRQRQNAQKRENEKAAKAEAESERLARLENHKRELEKAKMLEQYSGKSGGKTPSGGMKATVDERGKLIWE